MSLASVYNSTKFLIQLETRDGVPIEDAPLRLERVFQLQSYGYVHIQDDTFGFTIILRGHAISIQHRKIAAY